MIVDGKHLVRLDEFLLAHLAVAAEWSSKGVDANRSIVVTRPRSEPLS